MEIIFILVRYYDDFEKNICLKHNSSIGLTRVTSHCLWTIYSFWWGFFYLECVFFNLPVLKRKDLSIVTLIKVFLVFTAVPSSLYLFKSLVSSTSKQQLHMHCSVYSCYILQTFWCPCIWMICYSVRCCQRVLNGFQLINNDNLQGINNPINGCLKQTLLRFMHFP